ncbi:MAG: hypothetical protein HY951_01760 [Bacteroidia bacterium]|nr:hypothetical protein [Bacteroidia bacterium]
MKKSDYTRSTVECRYSELNPKFIEYLKSYLDIQKLGDIKEIEKEVINCFITTNLKKSLFGTQTNYTIICITKRFLFWGIISDKKDTGIGAAQWTDIAEIRNWEDTEMGTLVEEHGVEILGFMFRASHRSKWFIGLDENDAGKRCRTIVSEMIKK